MESQPQNPEFRNNPENFHPWLKSRVSIVLAFFCIKFYTDRPETSKVRLQILYLTDSCLSSVK